MARNSRFKKRDSDRSGFTYLERELVNDNGFLVGPDEFDTPTPSKKSLGGEGDISPGNVSGSYQGIVGETTASSTVVQYITAAGGISFSKEFYKTGEEKPVTLLRVAGSNNSNLDITADNQVSAGQHGDQLVIECVGSSIILENGSGLSLRKIFNMDSGALINLFYTETDSLWLELSRSHRTKVL